MTHVRMTLSRKLKGIHRHHYFPNIDGKCKHKRYLSQDNGGKLFYQSQFGSYCILDDIIPLQNISLKNQYYTKIVIE